ncbi:MAG: VWA domain-containing protein [Actinomycetes bacterium]
MADDAESGYADGDRVLPDRADELRRNAHAGATTIQAGLNEDPSDTRLVSAGRSLLAGERRSARIMLKDARLLATSDRDAVDVDGAARAVELAEEAWTAGKPVPAITHYGRAIAATLAVVRRHGVSYDDTADLDGDGIPDLAELRAGADPRVSDTDGDGLTDFFEISRGMPFHDPANPDTDGDGASDSAQDTDGDGLDAATEQRLGSNPLSPDTDGDALADGHEAARGSSLTDRDTDRDGLADAAEVSGGTDPLNPDSDGDGVLDGAEVITTTRVHDSGVTVALTGVGDLASRLHITELEDAPLVSGGPGRVSEAFDITLDPGARGALTSADITMPFDPTRVGGSETDLRLFTFDEELHAWVPAADDALQRIDTDANTVTATVEHFTVYAIFDIANWRSTWTALGGTCTPSGSGDVVFVDVAFTLDSSGSMSWNDPQGLRRSAAKSFVDALAPQDRGAVVDFDHWARLTQPLTSDKDALKAAIDRIDDWGGTNIGAGVSVGLNELARGDEPGRAQIMILLTDGEGSYSHTLTDRAAAAGVTIYTIGLGRAVDATLLRGIAERTGGQYYAVANAADLPEVFRTIEEDHGDDGRDTDGDGLSDCAETQGLHDSATGQVFTSDPRLSDTDGDGLSDGVEVGEPYSIGSIDPLLGTGVVYRVYSDPRKVDSDSDELPDLDEVYALTRPRSADTDGDGLTDGREEDLGLEPLWTDTDFDDLTDSWELARADEGYDPAVYDRQMSTWDYIGDYSRGVLCGDKEGVWGFCDGDSIPFLAGSLTLGFFGVGDVRDALANLVDGNVVSAAASVAFIIPVVGDGASIAAKVVKHLDRLNGPAQRRALTWAVKQDGLPDLAKVKALERVHGADAMSRLRGRGMDDAKLIALAKKGQNFKVLDEAVTGAARVAPSPGRYADEKDAQRWLYEQTPGSRMEAYQPPSGGKDSRRIDVYVESSQQATEVKKGQVRYSSRVKKEITNDVRNLNDPEIAVRGVDWQFFPDADGRVGPSEDLLKRLQDEGIPYTIWLP